MLIFSNEKAPVREIKKLTAQTGGSATGSSFRAQILGTDLMNHKILIEIT